MIARYWFLDWLGMGLAVLGLWLLGHRDRRGFVSFIASNLIWIGIGFWISSLAMVLGNIVVLVVNARGWLRWTAPQQTG